MLYEKIGLQQYWTTTGTYGDIDNLINKNFDDFREDIIKMLSGNRILVEVDNGINDLQTFEDKGQVITALIHLGYCAYDADTQEAYIYQTKRYMLYSTNLSKKVKTTECCGLWNFPREFWKTSWQVVGRKLPG